VRTVLVTGGCGFIGHHLVKELIAGKYKVIILDNLSTSNDRFMNDLQSYKCSNGNVFLHKQDIRNKEAVSEIFRLEGIDVCIHLAGKTSVQESIRQPHETINVNVSGTLNILQACSENNIDNFVFASSAAVYGHPRGLPVSEDHIVQPLSTYGASKVAGEALISSFSSRLKNCQILRFFNVYGEGQTSTYAGVITKFIERLSTRSPPIINGKGHQTRDFIHVSDIVRAIILASEIKQNARKRVHSPNILNIGTGSPTSILDLARTLISIFDLERAIEPIFSPPVTGDIIHSYANIKKAKQLLGFSAKKDLRSGLMNHQGW
jgi:UDP-glucose 4-epimerase